MISCLYSFAHVALLSSSPVPWYQGPVAVGGILVALLTALITIVKLVAELSNQRKLFLESQNIKEREDIRHKLNNFYGPFKELRAQSRLLYDIFALNLKADAFKQGQYFRALSYLAKGGNFSNSDKAILGEIVETGRMQLELITKEGWALSNPHLTELLGRLAAHIRLLILANDGKLRGMPEVLDDMVYPLEVDGAVETATRRLRDDYEALRYPSDRSKANTTITCIGHSVRKSVRYYDTNALEYYNKTARTYLSDVYKQFRDYIPRGGLILDAGCGVGRDTRFFIKHGYRVVSFDASVEMVNFCRQYPFAYCLHCSFEDITFIEEYDGVWACASLVHLPVMDLRDALLRLSTAVKPEGVIYFSLKDGKGCQKTNGRRFFLYDDTTIKSIATGLGLEHVKTWKNESRLAEDATHWTNYLYRKPKAVTRVEGPNR